MKIGRKKGSANHLLQTPSCYDITRVNKPIKMPSRLLYRLSGFIVTFEVENVRDKIKRVLVVVNLLLESGEVEPVSQVFFVDFAKVFVAARGNEPIAPVGGVVGISLRVIVIHCEKKVG